MIANRKKFYFVVFLLCYIILPKSFSQVQSESYQGVVTDKSGESFIGVSVIIKGTNTGTLTDLNGKFSIQTTIHRPTLIFSYVGFEKKEIVATTNDIKTVVLTEENKQLQDIVVVGSEPEEWTVSASKPVS